MLILGQLKSGVCKRIAAACTSSQTFLDLANAAVRQLMNRGEWWATVQPMRFCVQGASFVLPRFVGTVLAVNRCGRPTPVANRWFDFEPFEDWHRAAGQCCRQGEKWTGDFTGVSDGTTPILNQIPEGSTNYVRFYVTQAPDYGKTVAVFGLDANGQIEFSTYPDGTTQEGLVLTLAQPYVQSPIQFSKIFRIVKDPTVGVVNGYLYDPNTNLMNILGAYQPTETTPEYIHMRLAGPRQACCAVTQISALVKLQFIPFANDNDLVLIDNEDAIRDMIMSLREKESGDIATAQALELSAFRELNYQLKNKVPEDQFVVNFQPFGTANFNRATAGFM
jgi:hypothetical protein